MKFIRTLGLFSGLCLLVTAVLCITDLNHPPGVRYIRLFALLGVCAVGLLEFKKPWYGFAVSMVLWPLWLVIGNLLSRLSPNFHHLPWLQGGPLACCLCIAVWLRLEFIKKSEIRTESLPDTRWFTFSFLAIFISLLISTSYFYIRQLLNWNADWTITSPDVRHLLVSQPLSLTHPILGLVETLPTYALGLCVIESHRFGRITINWKLLAAANVFSGIIIVILTIPQILFGERYRWDFDIYPFSGPFPNRNIVAPVLMIIATVSISYGITCFRKKWYSIPIFGCALSMIITAIASCSRNAIFIFFFLIVAIVLVRPTSKKIIFLTLTPLIITAVIFYAPLSPLVEWNNYSAVQRTVQTIMEVREGKLHQSMSYRPLIYKTVFNIWKFYPLTGSGWNTFYMQVQSNGPFTESTLQLGVAPVHAHNAILHHLAEGGLLAMLGWTAAFIILPGIRFFKNSKESLFALSVGTVGVSNLADYSWYAAGVPLLGITVLIIFIGMRSDSPESENVLPH